MKTRSGRSTRLSTATRGTTTASTTKRTSTNMRKTATTNNSETAIPVTPASIMSPCVTDVSHPALVKWKRERQEYEVAIEESCATTGEDKSKALRSVKKLFNRQLLETLCKFEWGTTVETVTEERIIYELNAIVGNVMNDAIVDIDSIIATELKMDLHEQDVKARVINYFMCCDEIIIEHGLASTFSTSTGIKEKCKIRRNLEPPALREAVDTHQRIVDGSSKSNEQALYQLVKEKSLGREEVFRLLTKIKQL